MTPEKFIRNLIEDFGVRSCFDNVDEDNTIEQEGYWYECPICGEPVLLEDWLDKFISDICPICEEDMYE